MVKKPKPSKYKNIKTSINGTSFDSKGEAQRYGALLLMQKDGIIKDLKRQVKHPIVINNQKICTLIVDYVYTDIKTGNVILEDFKGMKETPIFRIKAKLVKAVYGLDIKITR